MGRRRLATQQRVRARRDVRRLAPPALAALLAAIYLLWQPPSIDLAAAEYRAWLFEREGLALWNGAWYGGHHVPGYSVLFPPLAAWLGPRVAGAIAVVAAAVLFERIASARFGERAWLGATWFALGVAATLYSGRLTFALGLVPALGALLALGRGRIGAAVGLALLTPLASPVAALFLALAAAAVALGAGARSSRAAGVAVAAAALVPVATLAVAFPEGGVEPFVSSAFWPVVGFALVALALLPREERTLRIGVALYALAAVAAFAIDTPLGGNVVRLGALCAGPLAALVLWRRRTLALACAAPLLLWWQLGPAVLDVSGTDGDPGAEAAYFAPLRAELEQRGAGPAGRVEVPFTKAHWEARHLAAGAGGRDPIPLARGWERQLDLKVNPLFYGDRTGAPPLTAARYRAWLDRMAVRWVALPGVALDYSARAEAALVARGLPYLRLVWRNGDWRLYEVRDPAPLAAPPARVTALTADTLTVAVSRPATVRLRIRWTPYWAVVAGDACVMPDGDWTALRVRRAGTVRLTTRFALDRVAATSPRCADRSAVDSG